LFRAYAPDTARARGDLGLATAARVYARMHINFWGCFRGAFGRKRIVYNCFSVISFIGAFALRAIRSARVRAILHFVKNALASVHALDRMWGVSPPVRA
jgi:hypothetical protein